MTGSRPNGWGRALALAAVTAFLIALLPPLSQAASVRGLVAKVKDGDSVVVKVGKRSKAFDLAGLDAPELTGDANATCFGAQAKAKLAKLLRKGAKVRLMARGRAAEIVAGRTNVNRAMVQGGFARAGESGGGRLGNLLRKDQAAAQAAKRGLWAACAPQGPPTPGPTPTDTTPTPAQDVTGREAKDRMTDELKSDRWRYFTSGYDSSTEYILNLCADGTFLRTAEGSGVLTYRYGTWEVTDAVIYGDASGRTARVSLTTQQSNVDNDPLLLDLSVRNSDQQWFWGDNAAQYFENAANCTPPSNGV